MRPKLREFLAALNALPATDSFWNAILETVLKLLAEIIITNLGIYRQKKRSEESMGMGEIYKVQMKKNLSYKRRKWATPTEHQYELHDFVQAATY